MHSNEELDEHVSNHTIIDGVEYNIQAVNKAARKCKAILAQRWRVNGTDWDTIQKIAWHKMPRESLLDFLEWNDGNGTWSDIDSMREGFDIMTYAEALAKVRYVLIEAL